VRQAAAAAAAAAPDCSCDGLPAQPPANAVDRCTRRQQHRSSFTVATRPRRTGRRLDQPTIIGADYVLRRRRYCDNVVMMYVCACVCGCVCVCTWLGVWVCWCVQRKPLIGMTWSLAQYDTTVPTYSLMILVSKGQASGLGLGLEIRRRMHLQRVQYLLVVNCLSSH